MSATPESTAPAWQLLALALLVFLLQLLTCNRFGYYRDELYFLSCGSRLAWGFVDHPPLTPALAALAGSVSCGSLFGLRLLPAMNGAVLVLLIGQMTKQLGGGRFARFLAAVAVLVAPIYLRAHSMLTPAASETVLWSVACLLLLRLTRGTDHQNHRLWLLWGLVTGVGLLNKYNFGFLTVATLAGMLATAPSRKLLGSRWPWCGCLLALALLAPNLIWQLQHGWPTLEFLRNLRTGVLTGVSLPEFVAGQVLLLNPLALPLWLAGLIWLLRSRAAARFRFLGWVYLLAFFTYAVGGGKIYYLAPVYPALMAAGAVAAEQWLAKRQARSAVRLATLYGAGLVLAGMALAPLGLPVVPIQQMDGYCRTISAGQRETNVLAGHYADMFGWPELAATVDSLWSTLPAADRSRGLVLAGNYGEAAALEFFGDKSAATSGSESPPVICGHNSYYFWSRELLESPPSSPRGEVCLAVGPLEDLLRQVYAEVTEIHKVRHPHAVYYEQDLPVYLCRWPRESLADVWDRFRHFN
ncbi:MAG: glycosyltransferase family 39 protein [bacterium]